MDVVYKEGTLYLQGVKFGKRTWRKIRMGLFNASSTGVGRLEFFTVADGNPSAEPRKAGWQKAPVRKVVRLSDCLSANFAPKASCPDGCTAFHLNTTRCTYTFASTTSQDWLSALCLLAFQKDPGDSDKGNFEEGTGVIMEDNDLYSSCESALGLPRNHFRVSVVSTEASRRCKLSGDYLLSSGPDAVTLLAANAVDVIYRWPYKMLRKFGQVEGGFSIEAGRRCGSGQGVFTFLTQHGPHIFQTISQHCAAEEKPLAQSPGARHRSLSPPSPPVLPAAATQHHPGRADVPAATEDEPARHCYAVNGSSVENVKPLSPVTPHLCSGEEAAGEEPDNEDEEELCYSLEALNQDNMEDSIYYNLRRAAPPLMRKDPLREEEDNAECVYSRVQRGDSASSLHLQPLLLPYAHFVHQPPPPPPPPSPYAPTTAAPFMAPRPRNQLPGPVDACVQTACDTPPLAGGDVKEAEEAAVGTAAAHVTPSEAAGSFKRRLAAIISKDLAKLQPPLPHGAGSPTVSQ